MNTYLLKYAGEWTLFICLTISSILYSGLTFSEEKFEVDNLNQAKNSVASIVEVAYETKKEYNDKLPSNVQITKQKGKNGLVYTNENNELVEVLENSTPEILEIGTGDQGEFTGKMTGYGADCIGCSGSLSCRTKSGKIHNLTKDGETYDDDEYGNVRILAAALNKFPCGTIVKVSGSELGTFNAIVLDTGSAMRSAFEKGIILMDLAYTSEKNPEIYKATSNNIKYSVQRWGW